MPGTLYVVSTPIGNLEDITLRALRILREADLIAAEDTRHTRNLLNHFEIRTPATAYHEHNKLVRLDEFLDRLRQGQNIALVSDAGTPCLSDPGWELVRACLDNNLPVDVAPGPAAPLVALILSGFAPQEFTFVGFPPRKTKELKEWLNRLKPEFNRHPVILFEAPHRLVEMLETALAVLGDRPVAVARELTKLHQEVRRELLSESLAHFQETPPRGEFSLVFAPTETAEQAETTEANTSPEFLLARLGQLKAEGKRAKEAVELLMAETGLPRRQIYDLWLKLA